MCYKGFILVCICVRAGWGVSRASSSRHHPASPRELRGDLLRRTDCAQLPRQWVQRLPPRWDYKISPLRNVTQPFYCALILLCIDHQMSAVMHNTQTHKCIFINRAFRGRVALLHHQSQRHRCGQGARPRWPHRLAAWKEEIWGLWILWMLQKVTACSYIALTVCPVNYDRRHWWLQRSASKTSRDMTFRKLGWLTSTT